MHMSSLLLLSVRLEILRARLDVVQFIQLSVRSLEKSCCESKTKRLVLREKGTTCF